jgi:WXG100 family type VII secretion target
MSQFDTSTELMQSTSSTVHAAAEEITSMLDGYRGRVMPLTEASVWKGDAQAMFTQRWTQWDTDARNLRVALDRIADLLSASGTSYVGGDADSHTAFQGVPIDVR